MKTWQDYKKEWEDLAKQNPGKLIVQKELYVVMHFLEDSCVLEPWREEDQRILNYELSVMRERDRREFLQYYSIVKDIVNDIASKGKFGEWDKT